MSLPNGAKLERILSKRVALYDVSHLLPEHDVKRYRTRDPKSIRYLIAHKSGADGRAGFAGLRASVNYVVKYKKTRSKPTGYPGSTYTFWIPQEFDRDNDHRLIVYRAQRDDVVSWHTGGGMNAVGASVCFQGNYDGDGDGMASRAPSLDQFEAAEELIRYASGLYGIDLHGFDDEHGWSLTGHWEHGKSVCPGDAIKAWVKRIRSNGTAAPKCRAIPNSYEVAPFTFTASERQQALKMLGYNPGPVDGLWGPLSRAALEEFQADYGLTVDGWLGKQTSAVMLEALRQNGLADRDVFKVRARGLDPAN